MNIIVGQITKHKFLLKVNVKMNGFLWEMRKLVMVNVMVKAIFKVKVKLESMYIFLSMF